MKAGKEHRVPLSTRVLEILQEVRPLMRSEKCIAFPAPRGSAYSDAAMGLLLAELGYKDAATIHGFRSSFRDWTAEKTSFPHDVCEMALAHTIANKAEKAYRRMDMLDRRRGLMTCWQMHCDGISLELANSAVTSLFNGLSAAFPHGWNSNVLQFRQSAA
jgi:integrase